MSDWEDYNNNLAFPPEGDWADKGIKATTDRTESSLAMVNKIEELTLKLRDAEEERNDWKDNFVRLWDIIENIDYDVDMAVGKDEVIMEQALYDIRELCDLALHPEEHEND